MLCYFLRYSKVTELYIYMCVCVCIYNVYILYILFHYGLSQESEYSSPCYTVLECAVTQLCLTLCYPRTVAHQAPLSVGLSRQEYWGGLPFPPPGDLSNPGIIPHLQLLH